MELKDFESIGELVEAVKCSMCNEYCKWPIEISEEEELYKKCESCPLNLL